jgi:hypothetical protein
LVGGALSFISDNYHLKVNIVRIMKKILLYILFLNANLFGLSSDKMEFQEDTLFASNYPEGIYLTKEDFLRKTPNPNVKVYPVSLYGREELPKIMKVHNCYFFDRSNSKKIKNAFAISFEGGLYFQIKAILKNRNKEDRAQRSNQANSFVRTIMGGDNYLYTEVELENKWAAGAVANLGAAGGATYSDIINGKGIVWDFKNTEFNIFKSCKDYNEFIKDKLGNAVQNCEEHQPDMLEVRKAISEIK